MNEALPDTLPLLDLAPETDSFLEEVVAGLARPRKTLPSKFFYDERGSRLFDRICELDEYYLTRTELALMETHAEAMAARLGPGCLLVEYGSGSSIKTRILLDHLADPAGYVPIDISREHLLRSAADLSAAYPGLPVRPVCADYTQTLTLPDPGGPVRRTVVYFPGSTIGNFEPEEARAFLVQAARVCGPGGALLIGVDLQKDRAVLEAAYNDAEGVTAAFNKNVLARINAELGADFDLDAFDHRAVYDAALGRIEMHLVSLRDQCARVGAHRFAFRRGETICTEYSHKYTLDGFARLAAEAGFAVEQVWTDARDYFSVQYLAAGA